MEHNRKARFGWGREKLDPKAAIGLMFDNKASELKPDPDERTDSDMDAMYGDEIRAEENLNIRLYINQLMKKVDDKLTELFKANK